jgi:L,D-transpeptidase catalytic domain
MSFSRAIFLFSLALAIGISAIAVVKKVRNKGLRPQEDKIEIQLTEVVEQQPEPILVEEKQEEEPILVAFREETPEVNRIDQLFTLGPNKLPIVETISYASRVPWLKGKPAWVADYASYYNTSRHFIARSLNKKHDYFSQNVEFGSRFNVFRKDKEIEFYFVVDLSKCKMNFYYFDVANNERVLLRTYSVGLGILDKASLSGSQTPLGKYRLGNKIGIYKKGDLGYYLDQKIEMIQVFGTRWIPFDREVENCTAPAKGYGIHGAPWIVDSEGRAAENRASIGHYESDGCIRLLSEDMEEIFAIVVTKPTYIEIVKEFHNAHLPGKEVAISTY